MTQHYEDDRKRSAWMPKLLTVGGLLLALPWVLGRVEATLVKAQARQELIAAPAEAAEADAPDPLPGDLVGLLEIPRLELEVTVLEGTDGSTLRRAAGHLPVTPLPHRPGNVAIAAHRDSFFRDLENVEPGDLVRLRSRSGVYTYEVEKTFVTEPSDISVIEDREGSTLTLITCFPFRYVGPAPERYVVQARLLSAAERI